MLYSLASLSQQGKLGHGDLQFVFVSFGCSSKSAHQIFEQSFQQSLRGLGLLHEALH